MEKWPNAKKVTFKFPLQQFSKCCQQIFSSSRSIVIKSCFNINRRTDCKHKFVVALYTNEDCFPIAFESEDELLRWFITFLRIQLVDKVSEGEELKPIYGKTILLTDTSHLIQSSLQITCMIIKVLRSKFSNRNLWGFIISFRFQSRGSEFFTTDTVGMYCLPTATRDLMQHQIVVSVSLGR